MVGIGIVAEDKDKKVTRLRGDPPALSIQEETQKIEQLLNSPDFEKSWEETLKEQQAEEKANALPIMVVFKDDD